MYSSISCCDKPTYVLATLLRTLCPTYSIYSSSSERATCTSMSSTAHNGTERVIGTAVVVVVVAASMELPIRCQRCYNAYGMYHVEYLQQQLLRSYLSTQLRCGPSHVSVFRFKLSNGLAPTSVCRAGVEITNKRELTGEALHELTRTEAQGKACQGVVKLFLLGFLGLVVCYSGLLCRRMSIVESRVVGRNEQGWRASARPNNRTRRSTIWWTTANAENGPGRQSN